MYINDVFIEGANIVLFLKRKPTKNSSFVGFELIINN